MFCFSSSLEAIIQAKNYAKKLKAERNSARAVTCRCPECGKPSSTYPDGERKIIDCPACGVLAIDRETGEVSKPGLNSDFR